MGMADFLPRSASLLVMVQSARYVFQIELSAGFMSTNTPYRHVS